MEQCHLFVPRVPDLSDEDNTVSMEASHLLSEVVHVKRVNIQEMLVLSPPHGWDHILCKLG